MMFCILHLFGQIFRPSIALSLSYGATLVSAYFLLGCGKPGRDGPELPEINQRRGGASSEACEMVESEEYEFEVYSPLEEDTVFIFIRKVRGGWHVRHAEYSGECDRQGHPSLVNILDRLSISYPSDLPRYLDWLWNQTVKNDVSHEDIQILFQELADWVTICEKNRPEMTINTRGLLDSRCGGISDIWST
jgi:hypothetical protein